MNRKSAWTLTVACLLSLSAQATPFAALRITAQNGESSLLLGSMHVPYPGMVLPDPGVLQNARTYVIEHTTADEKSAIALAPEVLAGIAANRDVLANWAKPLSEADIDRLPAQFNCASPEKASRETFRGLLKIDNPRLLAQLAWGPCLPGQRQSRDQWMEALAAKYKVPVVPLETQAEVGARRLAIPIGIYQKELFGALQADVNAAYREVVSAINRGAYQAAWDLLRTDLYTQEELRRVEQVMVTERNAAWIPRLTPVLDQGRAVILAGAAHLPGPQGMVALLKNRGYRVEPVVLDGTVAP